MVSSSGWWLTGLVVLGILFVGRGDRTWAGQAAGDSSVGTGPAVATSAGENSTTPKDAVFEETKLEKIATAWMQRVDDFFGRYLVAPLGAVLFFDPLVRFFGFKAGIPLVVAWLFCGAIFFTVRMNFINIRGFWHAIRLTKGDYDDPSDAGEVSHFQALAAALSATVGLGNIAGVAIAIGVGGPGACFWMIVVGLLGMTSKFTECTLGQMYRRVEKDGTITGGPMQYLKAGLSEYKWGGLGPILGTILSTLFALLCIGASFGGGCAFQVGQSLSAIQEEFKFLQSFPWVYGLIMALLTGIVIIGGIKSIGAVAGKIVPFMCGAYVLASLYILFSHYDHIPAAFHQIIAGAFNPSAVFGGLIGVLVQGIRRAVFSNEAGVGSAAIAHSAAKTDEPVSEGIVALLEPFIDTVVICTMTALVIIITDTYRVPTPEEVAIAAKAEKDVTDEDRQVLARVEAELDDRQRLIREHIGASNGAALTTEAFRMGGPNWFKYILFGAVVLFAYSTLISWSYYGERCWTSLFGIRASMAYKILFLVFVVLGSIVTRGNILDFSDMLILGMSFPNILGLLILSGKVKRRLDDYWERYQRGELQPVRK
jgi:AGCS family alanine or glycine:cation symporter